MNNLSCFKIAIKNVLHKPARSFGLMSLIFILSFVLFGGSILSLSLQSGLDRMTSRLGADLMVVPAENSSEMESILLQGTPSEFYFDLDSLEKIKNIDGVEMATSQFFLKSLNASCCSLPVQIIGFDPKTDFSIQPWIESVYSEEIKKGGVVVGSDIFIGESKTLKLFGETYDIVARLERTGTGLDQSIYVTMETMEDMYKTALEKKGDFPEDVTPQNSTSSILIKLSSNADKREVSRQIYRTVENIQLIEPKNMISNISQGLNNISGLISIFTTLFFVLGFLTLYIVFTISANERKKEFSILRVVGITKSKIKNILLKEAFIISFTGSILGILFSALIVFPFNTYIGNTLSLPYIQPQLIDIIKVLLLDLIISTLVGPLASIYAAEKISKSETYITMKESE